MCIYVIYVYVHIYIYICILTIQAHAYEYMCTCICICASMHHAIMIKFTPKIKRKFINSCKDRHSNTDMSLYSSCIYICTHICCIYEKPHFYTYRYTCVLCLCICAVECVLISLGIYVWMYVCMHVCILAYMPERMY